MPAQKGDIRSNPSVDLGAKTLTFTFGLGGAKADGFKPLCKPETFEVEPLPQEIKERLAVEGLKKKLMDDTSDFSKLVQEHNDPELRLGPMREVYERLLSGTYTKERTAGGGGGVPLVAVAIARRMEISESQALAAYKAQSKEAQEAIKESLKEDIEAIRKEQASASAPSVDLSDLT